MSERTESQQEQSATTSSPLVVAGAWALVGVPLAYGLWQTVVKAAALLG